MANYEDALPRSLHQQNEWAVLGTFDLLAPTYDQPQDGETPRAWFAEAGMRDVFVERMGFVVGRGTQQ